MALRLQVLQGYRSLFRARKIPFASDPRALLESAKELRVQFRANMHITDEVQIVELMQGVRDVEDMLRNGLVQGKIDDSKPDDVRVKVNIRKENAESMDQSQITPLDHLGDGLFPEKTLDDVVVEKSGKP